MGNLSPFFQRACTDYWSGFCRLCQLALLMLMLSAHAVLATTIDIMLVYDKSAVTWVESNGGMETFSQDAISRMNLAMQNSNVDITFRLVHAMTVNYTTTSVADSSLSGDLIALQDGEGVFAAVHDARTAYGADVVAMLVDHGSAYGFVGLGYLLSYVGGSPDYAFSVNAIQSVDISHTMTHEVGHNLGAHHAQNQAYDPGPNSDLAPYSAGYYFTGNDDAVNYHTIMAYDNDGFGNFYISAPLFSNPLILHQGTVAGDAATADNSRLLQETKATVAAYQAQMQPPFTLEVSSSGTSDVPISTNPNTYSGSTDYSIGDLASGINISLTAPINTSGFVFMGWSGCDSWSGNICSVTMNTDKNVMAKYVAASLSIGQAVDNDILLWATSGDNAWAAQDAESYIGESAAQSGNIGDDQISNLISVLEGPGTLRFHWKVSSEDGYDFLNFYLDDVPQSEGISGTEDWKEVCVEIPEGIHFVRWSYEKDFSASNGSDCGWLDNVVWDHAGIADVVPIYKLLLLN